MATMNPTAIKRWIAFEMRRLREAAGYDRAAAAERIGKAVTVIAHIESARNLPAPADMELLLDFYGVPERAELFRSFVKAAKLGKDWWRKFSTAIEDKFYLYVGLESGASRLSTVNLNVVPGLFQTRDYATHLIRSAVTLSDAQIEARIDLRMERQANVLEREESPLEVWAILDEALLRRMVGGPRVMQEQLRHLAQLTERPNIQMQVVPFSTGAHPGVDGAFIIIDYPPEFIGDYGTVYVENSRQEQFYESVEGVRSFRRIFERLQIQAEKPEESREIILNIAREIDEA